MDARLDTSIPDGQAISRSLGDGERTLPVILVRDGGMVRAYLNSCPHAGVRLDWRPDDFLDHTGSYLLCSMHGALFERSSGECVAGPCRGARLVELGRCADSERALVIRDIENLPSSALFRR
jgi:nitrite reductase/ring-hydroxylating ferredoxin subunit